MDFWAPLETEDREIWRVIKDEEERTRSHLELIASENYPSLAVLQAMGSVLTGKYGTDPNAGRAAGQLADRRYRAAAEAAGQLAQLARELDTTPAALAIAFALHNPNVATVLFGATSPEQLRQNAAGLELATRLDEEQWTRLLAIGAG